MIKKLLLGAAFICLSGISFAQVKWSVKTGLHYSNITARDRDGNKVQTSAIPGICLGLSAIIPLTDRFAINPTLVYAKRGFEQKGAATHIGWGKNFEARASYIELPVDFLYRPKIGPGNLLLAAGPYIGYGTGGRWTADGPVAIGDIIIDEKGAVAFQKDESYGELGTYVYAKPWDYGMHFRIGYILFDHYSISFEMQQGIADLQPQWADYKPESSIKNKSWGVSLGYRF